MFEGERRYNHFHILRNVLSQNYPAIYVPGIPPKKAVGNKDIDFVVERRYFLERFFLQMSELEYLKPCMEVKMFARPEIHGTSNEVDKLILKIPKPSPSELLPFYKSIFDINDAQIEEYRDKCAESIKQLEDT